MSFFIDVVLLLLTIFVPLLLFIFVGYKIVQLLNLFIKTLKKKYDI